MFDSVAKFIAAKAAEKVKDKIKDKVKGKAKSAVSSVVPQFMADWLSKEQILELEPRAKEVEHEGQKGRSGLIGEIFESFLARKYPAISKTLDLLSTGGVTDRDPEIFAWQNEFETLTALTMLVPDALLRKITDPLAQSEVFLKAVETFHEELAEKIRAKKDPDDVVNALRELHQYISTGKVAVEKFS